MAALPNKRPSEGAAKGGPDSSRAKVMGQAGRPGDSVIVAATTLLPNTRREAELLEKIVCPVCRGFPRRSSVFCKETLVFNCPNAHLTCGFCVEGMRRLSDSGVKCPTCRNPHLYPSPLGGNLAEIMLRGRALECRHKHNGCTKMRTWELLWDHEASCYYREVECISRHRSTCSWQGPLPELGGHMREKDCVQRLLPCEGSDSVFVSQVNDFNTGNVSVFNNSLSTYWKPVLFVSEKAAEFLIYMTIERSVSSHWYLAIRSVSPQHIREKIGYKLIIYQGKASDRQPKTHWKGSPISHSALSQDSLQLGEFLLLHDHQLQALRNSPEIFEYSVELDLSQVEQPAVRRETR